MTDYTYSWVNERLEMVAKIENLEREANKLTLDKCASAMEMGALKNVVMMLGERADTCVYDYLHEICDYCRCHRKREPLLI